MVGRQAEVLGPLPSSSLMLMCIMHTPSTSLSPFPACLTHNQFPLHPHNPQPSCMECRLWRSSMRMPWLMCRPRRASRSTTSPATQRR
jgi:hypothetical protein